MGRRVVFGSGVEAVMHNNIAHFAIHANDCQRLPTTANDCQRAKTFHESTFGWQFEPWGPPNFWRIHTGPGGIHGALQERREPLAGSGMRGFECTIAVEDVAAMAKTIAANGGKLTMDPFEIEGVGTLVMFEDTEGNVVGAMQYSVSL